MYFDALECLPDDKSVLTEENCKPVSEYYKVPHILFVLLLELNLKVFFQRIPIYFYFFFFLQVSVLFQFIDSREIGNLLMIHIFSLKDRFDLDIVNE